MSFGIRPKLLSTEWLRDYLFILIGSFFMAAGYVWFIVPYKIVPGGVYGIAIVLHYLLGVPTGITGLILNIPLLLWGIHELGPKFGVKTLVGLVLTSVFIDAMAWLWGPEALIADDIMISSVFGGLAIGVGLAFIFRAKATTGGSDIVAQVWNKYTRLPVGQALVVVDTLVVLLGVVAFGDIRLALYAIVTIYVTGKVVDAVVTGFNYRKGAFIVSDRPEFIRPHILEDLSRGGTFFYGAGMYRGQDKKIIFTAVNRRELAALQDFVRREDPNAFMTVFDIHDVLGEGFRPFEDA